MMIDSVVVVYFFFFFKKKTAYEMRISDWSSDVCSSDLTDGDIIVRLPDADVVVLGDLVEESGPPAYGPDCWPMEWPTALDLAISLMTDHTVVVPGHGAVTNSDFVHEQRGQIGVVAETIRDLAGRGIPVGQALVEGGWPWPEHLLDEAVRRGYAHLPRTAKRLPLI